MACWVRKYRVREETMIATKCGDVAVFGVAVKSGCIPGGFATQRRGNVSTPGISADSPRAESSKPTRFERVRTEIGFQRQERRLIYLAHSRQIRSAWIGSMLCSSKVCVSYCGGIKFYYSTLSTFCQIYRFCLPIGSVPPWHCSWGDRRD